MRGSYADLIANQAIANVDKEREQAERRREMEIGGRNGSTAHCPWKRWASGRFLMSGGMTHPPPCFSKGEDHHLPPTPLLSSGEESAVQRLSSIKRRIIRPIECPSAFPTPPVYMLFFQKFFSLYGQFPRGRFFCPEVSYGRSTRHFRGEWMVFLIMLLTGNQNNQLQHDIIE